MREERHLEKPFQALGNKLKSVREQQKQSMAEVSGAVEIDNDVLEKIESGEQRPSEDILLLMISHFDLKDEEAARLWELAGYSDTKSASAEQRNIFDLNQPVAMLMPMDLRVVYTDMVHVIVNDFGVVMNFMQGTGQNNQPLAVARIGMSKEHAQSVLEILQQSLHQQKRTPKTLPSNTPKDSKNSSKRSEA